MSLVRVFIKTARFYCPKLELLSPFESIGVVRLTQPRCLILPPLLLTRTRADGFGDDVEVARVKIQLARSKAVQREGKNYRPRLDPGFDLFDQRSRCVDAW